MSDFTTTPNLGLYKPTYDADAEMWGTHLNANADVLDSAFNPTSGVFVPLAGGNMTGPLALAGDPTAPLGAATRQYVDAVRTSLGNYLPLAGGTVTGALTLNGSPTALTVANGTIAIPTNQQLQGKTWLAVGQNKALVNSGALSPVIGGTIGAISGTITGSGVPSFYNFQNGTDVADSSGLSNQLALFRIGYSYGGSTLKGGRVALTVQSGQTASASPSSGNPFYSVANFWQTIGFNEGGTAPTIALSSGQVVGLNPQLVASPGATNFTEMSLAEWNIVVQAGASTARKFGIKIAPLGNDAVQGTVSDAALKFGGASSVGWKNLILCGGDISTWSGTGNILSGQVSTGTGGRQPASRRGISLEQIAFPAITTINANDGFLRSNAFSVDGLGMMQIGTAYLTPQSTGLAIDASGIVGTGAITVAAGGAGYGVGDFLFDAWGGIYTVTTAPSGVVSAVSVYADANGATRYPYYPGSTPPTNPVATTAWGVSPGTGCTLNLNWDSTRKTLALNPSGSPTTVGGTLTLIGAVRFNSNVGFNNTAPIARPTVSGAKGSNAALASLMTALAAYGLVTDSTTA